MGVLLNVSLAVAEKENENIQLESVCVELEKLQSNIMKYVNDCELEAEAYSNHKFYITNIHLPLLNGLVELCNKMIDANSKYINILNYYFPNQIIMQDMWEDSLASLIEQYNAINNQYYYNQLIDDFEPINTAMTQYSLGYNIYMESYGEELDALYNAIIFLKYKLRKLQDMFNDLVLIYYNVGILKDLVFKAIYEIKKVSICDNGYYSVSEIDLSVFNEVSNYLAIQPIAQDISEYLSSEGISISDLQELLHNQDSGHLSEIMSYIINFTPVFTNVSGHVEFTIFPGVTVYFENIVSPDYGGVIPINCEITLENTTDLLVNNYIDIGDVAVGATDSSFSICYEEQIDDYSNVYIEITNNYEEGYYSIENGITTESNSDDIGESWQLTVAAGIQVENNNSSWQAQTVDVIAYSEVSEPIYEGVISDVPVVESEYESEIFDAISLAVSVVSLFDAAPGYFPNPKTDEIVEEVMDFLAQYVF